MCCGLVLSQILIKGMKNRALHCISTYLNTGIGLVLRGKHVMVSMHCLCFIAVGTILVQLLILCTNKDHLPIPSHILSQHART